ncbi:MAG: aminotransferase class V-fold PLP-dependent enzyme [Bacteroidia bacterium]|nr:aminotransferase class V-fold PLP-dependent enzyme [Sphingobacteriaceae bacterium]MBP9069107.1 aminotransferase class V-fold PLP-dependent enzyme [Bacteroidia bacterium]
MDKRTFLKTSSLLGIGSLTGFKGLEELMNSVAHVPAKKLASDEDFWADIRKGYKLKPDYVNLENGYYCIQPQYILEAYLKHLQNVNMQGAFYMRTVQYDNKKRVAAKLAELAGCTKEELIITRNTTESLDLIISGMDWKAGDEAVMAEQDYGAMLDMFTQVSKRYGMSNKLVSIPNHPESDEEIVQLYESAITPNTKLLMVCHMINITGQVLPIKKICQMAHSKGVPVMVDGAHAFAHLDFKLSDLDCDYYGCSLHKWLSVPLGAGFLYVKRDNISKVWPLFAESEKEPDDISRLNHTGTIPVHTDLAIENAMDYYNKIGAKRKEERLRYLQTYWTKQVRNLKNVILNTPEDPQRSCAIANVGIKGMKPADMAKTLLDKYKIYTVAIDGKGVQGCRITPNVYTSTAELDQFVKALKEMAAS